MTLAVRLGDRRTRLLFVALLVTPYVVLVPVFVAHPSTVIVLITAVPAGRTVRNVLRGATGMPLVVALRETGQTLLLYGLLLLATLAWLDG